VLEILRRDIDRVLALGGWDGIAQVDRTALAPAVGAPLAEAPRQEAAPRPVETLPRQRAAVP
jgi:hypothetical protein